MAKRTAPKCSQALPAMGSNSVAGNDTTQPTNDGLKHWREWPAGGGHNRDVQLPRNNGAQEVNVDAFCHPADGFTKVVRDLVSHNLDGL